ncbi:MAG: hypothetical protein GEV09_17380 [Pseudonocardiaceae bacterium]|nr:hypothetical protein [Pseudonocardiaceae bacterium]
MTSPAYDEQPARTVLEDKIRQRRQTFEEFAEYAETFAHEHREPGTLSARHLQRLAAGRRADGRPIGPVRPATRRLLEHIFGCSVEELLGPSGRDDATPEVSGLPQQIHELSSAIAASQRVDDETVLLLRQQVDAIRHLDRRLGAITLLPQLREQASYVAGLLHHAIAPRMRRELAAVLADACTLAGWQSMDRGELAHAWRHYETATAAAREAGSPALESHALAEQAVTLLDIGHTRAAVDMTVHARALGDRAGPRLLRTWLAAAHGEALAAHRDASDSLRAYDDAGELLPAPTDHESPSPYIALDATHLARWRGHALSRFGHPDAIDVLTSALECHDQSFTRGETSLRVDLAHAHAISGHHDAAREHRAHARNLALTIGSVRQQRRLAQSNA